MHLFLGIAKPDFDKIKIEDFPLYSNDEYWINLYFGGKDGAYEILENAIKIQLIDEDIYGTGWKLDPKWNKVVHRKITIT